MTPERIRRNELSKALHWAECGDLAPLHAYLTRWLPADGGAEAIMEFIQQNRAQVAVRDQVAAMEHVIERLMHARERFMRAGNGGRLPRGTRTKLLEEIINELEVQGELQDGPGEIKPTILAENIMVRGRRRYFGEQKLVVKLLPIDRERILGRLRGGVKRMAVALTVPRIHTGKS